ncbi:MAG: RdgB/HAM1 family non-canonical purine NTP pyrophosphatase [Acidobacteria bacterium]|nr:RdgB/HAM1 family non-canonical purine NTP pyrophosphatase [Acidobacteriota bacterium]
MTPILIATTNRGKLREIRQILRGLSLRLESLGNLATVPEPVETGQTFEENAQIKAHAYARATGRITVAEDSGLVIDALGGAPGIHSARYPGTTYADKFAGLHAALAAHPRPWTARYVCALALVHRGQLLFETTGAVEGEIWPEPRGGHGFGYDPIFYYPPYQLTFGEVDETRKLVVAHRGQAFLAFREWVVNGRLSETIQAVWLR